MIEIVKEPEWLPTTCVDHRFTTHPLTETIDVEGKVLMLTAVSSTRACKCHLLP